MQPASYYIALAEKYGARNYHPLPIVVAEADRVWVTDPEGKKYMDMLSAYSALNQGHRHPKIIEAMRAQLERVTLSSRAFHNDQMGPFMELLCNVCKMEKTLVMNSGAEAVETAIKAARKWGYEVKGVPEGQAEIIVCENNFHGRTTTIVGFSSEPQYKQGFGPFTPGFKTVPYGDAAALEAAITEKTVAFLVEPIQGEAGIIIPPAGYLKAARQICTQHNVLLMADEIQTGLGRTGRMFACEHEDVRPDIYILGKALGGGAYPISAIVADSAVMDVFRPGDHGSTFGGNPLACAVAQAAIRVVIEEQLPERAADLGEYFLERLRAIESPHVKEIRGKGLMIGIEIKSESGPARPFCERLMQLGLLCKETHGQVIRLAPPLIITKSEIDWALEKLRKALL
ncbi:MAG: ornithine--oxo-acid transaminase [Acidobacteriota bacterium]|nr:ornithine--oxo-acid transaminase [Blastocatellia bacterium]MDW8413290.1 ornithine--oxo-acid transaminase [Acidobacteriota bacterium]